MRCHNLIRTCKTWVMWFTAVATNVTASDASSFAPTMPRPSHIAMTQVARPVESLLIIETKTPTCSSMFIAIRNDRMLYRSI